MVNIFVYRNLSKRNLSPVEPGRKLNVHKTSCTSSERLMYVQFKSCVCGEARRGSLGDHLLFCNHSVRKVFNRNEREPVDNERSTIFEWKNYIGTIVPYSTSPSIRSLREIYLFLIVATYSHWMNFLLHSSWSWDWTLPFSRVVIRLL